MIRLITICYCKKECYWLLKSYHWLFEIKPYRLLRVNLGNCYWGYITRGVRVHFGTFTVSHIREYGLWITNSCIHFSEGIHTYSLLINVGFCISLPVSNFGARNSYLGLICPFRKTNTGQEALSFIGPWI